MAPSAGETAWFGLARVGLAMRSPLRRGLGWYRGVGEMILTPLGLDLARVSELLTRLSTMMLHARAPIS